MVLPQTLLVCQTFQIMFAGNPYTVALLPKGDCALCCGSSLGEDIVFMTHRRSGESQRAGVATRAALVDPAKSTVIYVHGFTEQGGGASATTVRQAYFATDRDVNFVTMDWGRLCPFPWYANAVDNVPVAGRYLAIFLQRLFLDGVRPRDVHVIGFSLGAEVAGFAAQALRDVQLGDVQLGDVQLGDVRPYRLGRITGLDPAFPLLRWTTRDGHLSEDDADFVDVIHTDGGAWGVRRAIGHADFYPNGGGATQPGCRPAELRAKGQFPQEFVACSHSRAWAYYAESVLRGDAFLALRCRSAAHFRSGRCTEDALRLRAAAPANHSAPVAFMGITASEGCRGSYYVDTNGQFPFGRGVALPVDIK